MAEPVHPLGVRPVSQHPLRRSLAFTTVLLLAGATLPGRQGPPVFGPRVFTRDAGEPRAVTDQFPAPRPGSGYVLRVQADGLASGRVTLNGSVVLEARDFDAARSPLGRQNDRLPPARPPVEPPDVPGREARDAVLERQVSLAASNTLVVELSSRPGSSITVTIEAGGLANQPPRVDVGPDLEVTQQDGALLNATVEDDGRVTGAGVTCAWSVTRAPAGARVSFEPPRKPSTRVLFSMLGTYVLRLTASDGVLSSYDELTVAVVPEPPNKAPAVSAGPDRSATIARATALNGSVSDDGRPSGAPLTIAWAVVSAPAGGGVTFADPASARTSAAFSALGTYVLRLTASDSVLSAWDEVTIRVNDVPPPRPPDEPPANHQPTAAAGGPYSGAAGLPIAFAGSGSDPDHDPLTFTWRFSDGGTAAGAAATHTFAAAGNYTATLTVSDGRGGTASSTAAVTVTAPANRAPTASAGGPYRGRPASPSRSPAPGRMRTTIR